MGIYEPKEISLPVPVLEPDLFGIRFGVFLVGAFSVIRLLKVYKLNEKLFSIIKISFMPVFNIYLPIISYIPMHENLLIFSISM